MAEIPDPIKSLPRELGDLAHELANLIKNSGGRLLLVGGCVRDLFIGSEAEEIDCEIQNIGIKELKLILSTKYTCHEVGKSFGVLKLKGLPAELSLQELRLKQGPDTKDFPWRLIHHCLLRNPPNGVTLPSMPSVWIH